MNEKLLEFEYVITPKTERSNDPDVVNAENDRIAGLFDTLTEKIPGQPPSPQQEAWWEIVKWTENAIAGLGKRFEEGPDGHSDGYIPFLMGMMVGLKAPYRHINAVRAIRDKHVKEAERAFNEAMD